MFHTASIQAKALVYTILLAALCHLFITLFVAITQQQPDLANMFNILGISLLVPALGKGSGNALLGAVTVVIIWVVFIRVMQVHHKRKNQSATEK